MMRSSSTSVDVRYCTIGLTWMAYIPFRRVRKVSSFRTVQVVALFEKDELKGCSTTSYSLHAIPFGRFGLGIIGPKT